MTAADLRKFRRQIILVVLGCTLPFIISAIVVTLDDHYTDKAFREDAVTKEQLYHWQMLQERRVSNLEIIVMRADENSQEVKEELREIRRQVNDHIEKAARTRAIPEEAIIRK